MNFSTILCWGMQNPVALIDSLITLLFNLLVVHFGWDLINSIKWMSGSGPNFYLFASIIIYCNLMSIMLSIILRGISTKSRTEPLTQERTFRLIESNQSIWTFFVIQTSTIIRGKAEDRLRRKALLLHTHTK